MPRTGPSEEVFQTADCQGPTLMKPFVLDARSVIAFLLQEGLILELAFRSGVPIATQDHDLTKAAKALKVARLQMKKTQATLACPELAKPWLSSDRGVVNSFTTGWIGAR
jgi:hypothetical protein